MATENVFEVQCFEPVKILGSRFRRLQPDWANVGGCEEAHLLHSLSRGVAEVLVGFQPVLQGVTGYQDAAIPLEVEYALRKFGSLELK